MAGPELDSGALRPCSIIGLKNPVEITTIRSTKGNKIMRIKPQLIFVLAASVVSIGILVATTLKSAPNSGNGQQLEGSWVVDATVTGSAQVIKALLTCTPNGEVVETPSVATAVSTGHGGWIRLGHNEFSLTVVYLRRDDNGELIGTSKVSSTLRVNQNFTTGSGRFETKVFDLNGNLIDTFVGFAQAQRIQVEAFQ